MYYIMEELSKQIFEIFEEAAQKGLRSYTIKIFGRAAQRKYLRSWTKMI